MRRIVILIAFSLLAVTLCGCLLPHRRYRHRPHHHRHHPHRHCPRVCVDWEMHPQCRRRCRIRAITGHCVTWERHCRDRRVCVRKERRCR